MRKIEILAPVRDMQTLEIAIGNGADAVYFGISEFNARNIESFSLDNIQQAIDKAHLFGVKVYLTVNILYRDEEFAAVDEILTKTSSFGVDGYIIQDIGLYYYIKQKFPNLEIHASTQMGFENVEGVKLAKKLGFERVVLAREVLLDEIKKIHDNVDIELEYFVQGALCVSYSGNCYLCSLLDGNSGNRGKCKQFCRLNYSLSDGNDEKHGYLLSTKDFCMLPHLKDLYDSGICSFKIEGRARREGYIASAVNVYKRAIENNFKYTCDDELLLKKAFNRGDFSAGYFDGGKIIYPYAQNHIGVKIGQVQRVNNGKKFNEIDILSSHKLQKDDVIKFFIDKKEVGIISVVDVKEIGKDLYRVTTTNKIAPNAEVRLIVDANQGKKILTNKRQLKVDARLVAKIGQKAELTFETENAKVTVCGDETLQEGLKYFLTAHEAKSQIQKLGDEFVLNDLTCDIEKVFVAKSSLNNLRRIALEKLREKILENYKNNEKIALKSQKMQKNINFCDKKQQKLNIIEFNNFEKLNKKDFENDILIFKPNDFSKEKIEAEYDKYKDFNVYISLPILATSQECERLKDICKACENWGIVANNYYALELKPKDKVIIGSGMNVFNSYAVKFYEDMGYKTIIVSQELDDEIHAQGVNLAYYSSYYPELMHFNHCPMKEHFASRCDKCVFKDGFVYNLNNHSFDLVRRKILKCQFILKSKQERKVILSENYSKIKEII